MERIIKKQEAERAEETLLEKETKKYEFTKCGVNKNVIGLKVNFGVDNGAALLTKGQLDNYEELELEKEQIIKEWIEEQEKADADFLKQVSK